jgi:hypothetical protein
MIFRCGKYLVGSFPKGGHHMLGEENIREKIHERLQTGQLPVLLEVRVPDESMRDFLRTQKCSACDDERPDHVFIAFSEEIFLHDRCFDLWDLERKKSAQIF